MIKIITLVACAGLARPALAGDAAAVVKPKKTPVVAHFASGGSGRGPSSSGISGFQGRTLTKPVIPVKPVAGPDPVAPNCPDGTAPRHNGGGGIQPWSCVKLAPTPDPVAPNCPEGSAARHNAGNGLRPWSCVKLAPTPDPVAPRCPAGTAARHNDGGGLVPYSCVKAGGSDDLGPGDGPVPLLR
jgi:hypothetical protein